METAKDEEEEATAFVQKPDLNLHMTDVHESLEERMICISTSGSKSRSMNKQRLCISLYHHVESLHRLCVQHDGDSALLTRACYFLLRKAAFSLFLCEMMYDELLLPTRVTLCLLLLLLLLVVRFCYKRHWVNISTFI